MSKKFHKAYYHPCGYPKDPNKPIEFTEFPQEFPQETIDKIVSCHNDLVRRYNMLYAFEQIAEEYTEDNIYAVN